MKRLLLYICALALSLPIMAQTAPEVVKQFLDKVDKQTLTSDFNLTLVDKSGPLSYSGSVRMRGHRFLLTMLEAEAAYDGKTLYMYSADIDELTLSTPTQEELLEANPVLFAEALSLQSTIVFSRTTKEGAYVIDFIPDNKSAGVQKFVLTLRKSDLMPLQIEMREKEQTTTIYFKSARYEAAVPSFVLTKKGAFLNDLR